MTRLAGLSPTAQLAALEHVALVILNAHPGKRAAVLRMFTERVSTKRPLDWELAAFMQLTRERAGVPS